MTYFLQDSKTDSKIFDSLWIMKETKKITAVVNVKLNKSASIYRCMQGFINMRQGEAEPNDTFKLRLDNIYETMELSDGDNTLRSKQLTNNGSQALTK